MATNDTWVPPSNPDTSGYLHIVLIGKTGTGKSATGNTLLGETIFKSKAGAGSVTKAWGVVRKDRFGKTLVVVDTPGFMDINMSREQLAQQLVSCTCLACPGVHAFLLLLHTGHRYTEDNQKAIESIKQMFGEQFVTNTIVVFTGKDTLEADGQTVNEYKSELPTGIQTLIKSCRGSEVVISNRGMPDEKEQTAEQIIDMVNQVVRQNGGESKYYRTALFDEMSEKINEKVIRILKGHNEIKRKIRLVQEEMEPLTREDQCTQRQQLQQIIDDIEKKLIDEDTAREKAADETQRDMYKIIIGIGTVTLGVIIALLKK